MFIFDGSDSFSVVLRIFLLGEESYSEVVVGVRKTFGILHLLQKFENECLVSRACFLRHPHILTTVLHFLAVPPEALTI